MMRRLDKYYSITDLRLAARRRLPKVIFDYLVDVSEIDLTTTILGQQVALPLILSPTGMNRLFHHRGEMAVVPAAAGAGIIYSLSSVSSYDIETVAKAATGPKWFQIYVWKDRAVIGDFIQRCRESDYQALCLTVDLPALGKRERDLRNGMTLPPRLSLRSVIDVALHPQWCWHYLTTPKPELANIANMPGKGLDNVTTQAQHVNQQLDATVTWDDMAWMIEQWGGPFVVKGILSPEDAKMAVATGVQGIIVSNHGGRQLDHAPAPIDVLPAIVEAVGNRAEVILDGGIRRGTDVVKALALGARACMMGRGYLYGLGAGGEAGVSRALELLQSEILCTMQLIGCTRIADLNTDYLRTRSV